VRLARGGEPRAAALAAESLNEARWLAIEKTWLLRIATAMLAQDLELGRAYEEAVAAAQAATAPANPCRPIEEYARMVAAIEAGEDPPAVFAAARITAAEWGALQRGWTERLAGDPALTRAFREMVAGVRAAR
jgi:hypothetical protein